MKTVPTPEQQRFIDETLSKPEVNAWLAKFKSRMVVPFLVDYHKNRAQYIDIGSHHARDRNERLTRTITSAEELLPQIQQKKLWDLQCQWRAELIDVPGVQHGGDFISMQPKVMALDFLPPITVQEVELMKYWLTDYHASHRTHASLGFQDYSTLISKNEVRDMAREDYPLYYDFIDAQTKTVPLWKVLPDKRGEKELRYYWEGRKSQMRKESKPAEQVENSDALTQATPEVVWDDKPTLHCYGQQAVDFAKLIEEHRIYEAVDCYFNEHDEEDYTLDWAIEILQKAPQKQPIEANVDWREGVLRAAHRYQHTLIADALDVAYENYLFRLKMGIAPADDEESHQGLTNPEHWADAILAGREALGEPRDFNF